MIWKNLTSFYCFIFPLKLKMLSPEERKGKESALYVACQPEALNKREKRHPPGACLGSGLIQMEMK